VLECGYEIKTFYKPDSSRFFTHPCFANRSLAMTKVDLIEKILRKTGLTQEEFEELEPKIIFNPNARVCSVAKDLQGVIILCLRNDEKGGAHAKKPKEIVVVGSKVFVVPSGFFDSRD